MKHGLLALAILVMLFIWALVLCVSISAQQTTVPITIQKPIRLVEVEKRIAELEAEERVIQSERKESPADKLVPDSSYNELRVSIRAELISLRKEKEKLEHERLKSESKEQKQARAELQHEADKAKHDKKHDADALKRTGLVCPIGGEEEVIISRAVSGPTLGFVHSRMNIYNYTEAAVNISRTDGGGGVVVWNLCPGGKASITDRIGNDGYKTIGYSAGTDKKAVISFSPKVYLSPCYGGYCTTEYSAIWEIKK